MPPESFFVKAVKKEGALEALEVNERPVGPWAFTESMRQKKKENMPQEIKTIHFGGVNCYLVKTGDDGYVLIDTGFTTRRTDIEKVLESAPGCYKRNGL